MSDTASFAAGDPSNGIAGYDLKFTADRVLSFDYNHSGKLDRLVMYRFRTGNIWIVKNDHGIGGYDLHSTADPSSPSMMTIPVCSTT